MTARITHRPLLKAGRKPALSAQQANEAIEMYLQEGKSRREVAAALQCNESSVMTALRNAGVPMRERAEASTAANKARIGHHRKTQLITSIWELGRPPRRTATP